MSVTTAMTMLVFLIYRHGMIRQAMQRKQSIVSRNNSVNVIFIELWYAQRSIPCITLHVVSQHILSNNVPCHRPLSRYLSLITIHPAITVHPLITIHPLITTHQLRRWISLANGGYTFAQREVADELRGLHGHGSTKTTTSLSATMSATSVAAGGTAGDASGTPATRVAGGGGSGTDTDTRNSVGVDETTATRIRDAARLYTMAAEGGDIRSLMSLGWMMLDEEGTSIKSCLCYNRSIILLSACCQYPFSPSRHMCFCRILRVSTPLRTSPHSFLTPHLPHSFSHLLYTLCHFLQKLVSSHAMLLPLKHCLLRPNGGNGKI